MKLHPILLPVLAFFAAAPFARADPPAVAGDPVLWSIHFDAERLRSGVGRELFASLDPVLTALSGESSAVPGGKLGSIIIFGFQPSPPAARDFPFISDIRFTPENGGISNRFFAVSRKRRAPVEDLAGRPAIHFQHEGKEIWIVKDSDSRVLLSMSRARLEKFLASDANVPASSPPPPDEILGGNVEIRPLLAGNGVLGGSELLKLLPHVEFHLAGKNEQLDLNASAELDSERSARRAARMIDGMVAGLSLHDASVPWDERLVLQQNGPGLALQLHLEPGEAKHLLESFAREIEIHVQSARHQE